MQTPCLLTHALSGASVLAAVAAGTPLAEARTHLIKTACPTPECITHQPSQPGARSRGTSLLSCVQTLWALQPRPGACCGSAPADGLLARGHSNQGHRSGSGQAALTAASITPKRLLPWGNGKITTQMSQTVAPQADSWSDYRPPPPMKAPQGTIQGKCPAVWCYCIPGKCLI